MFLPTILWLVTGFQSPRSGQICSNPAFTLPPLSVRKSFNPLDRVKFVQIIYVCRLGETMIAALFQSPRSGQICSNKRKSMTLQSLLWKRLWFQSPRSGQICSNENLLFHSVEWKSFNPLDRVKFVQIRTTLERKVRTKKSFQSPRSGQICSNASQEKEIGVIAQKAFQSPRSGQICSNQPTEKEVGVIAQKAMFQSPRSGQICSNNQMKGVTMAIIKSFNPLDRVKFVQMESSMLEIILLFTLFQSPRSGQICSNPARLEKN